jgi:hypothetical protein
MEPVTAITDAQRSLIADWLRIKSPTTPLCPLHGETKWIVGKYFAGIPVKDAEEARVHAGPFYPYVTFVCERCGYTMFINAVVMGLLKADD